MTDQYTVRMGEQDYGPVDLALLKAWRTEGRLLPESLVWKHGSPGWVPFSAILETEDGATALVSPGRGAGHPSSVAAAPGAPLRGAEPTVTLLELGSKAAPRAASPNLAGAGYPHASVAPTPTGGAATPRAPAPDPAAPHAVRLAAGSFEEAAADAVPRPATRPRPMPPVRRPAPPAAGLPVGWLLVGGILVLLVVAGVMAYSLFLRPLLDKRRVVAEIRQKALPDRKLVDSKAGLDLALPNGWYLLPADSTLVLDPGSRDRLAHPARGAFASLRMEEQARLDIPLEAYAQRQLEGRRLLRPDVEQIGSEEGRIAGQPSHKVAVRWTEEGSKTEAVIVVWRDAWRWYTLSVWAVGSSGESPTALAQALGGGLTLTDRLTDRLSAAATSLENDAPELGRASARLLAMDALATGQPTDRLSIMAIREVSRGLHALSPDEVLEMTHIYAQIYAPVPDQERARLAAWLAAVRDGRNAPPDETLAMRALLNQGILSLPEEARTRLIELNTEAVSAALRTSS